MPDLRSGPTAKRRRERRERRARPTPCSARRTPPCAPSRAGTCRSHQSLQRCRARATPATIPASRMQASSSRTGPGGETGTVSMQQGQRVSERRGECWWGDGIPAACHALNHRLGGGERDGTWKEARSATAASTARKPTTADAVARRDGRPPPLMGWCLCIFAKGREKPRQLFLCSSRISMFTTCVTTARLVEAIFGSKDEDQTGAPRPRSPDRMLRGRLCREIPTFH